MHEPMSPQREAIVRREMADPTYAGTWHIQPTETGTWEITHNRTVLAVLPKWAKYLALWIADARDDVPQLLALVDQLRAELTESNAKLEIAERRNADLADQLAERTRRLNGLLDSLSFDEKAVPA